MDASLNTQDKKEWMTGRYSLDESLILLCVIVLLSVKASQNNFYDISLQEKIGVNSLVSGRCCHQQLVSIATAFYNSKSPPKGRACVAIFGQPT